MVTGFGGGKGGYSGWPRPRATIGLAGLLFAVRFLLLEFPEGKPLLDHGDLKLDHALPVVPVDEVDGISVRAVIAEGDETFEEKIACVATAFEIEP
jgi:hypothetical protein